MAVSQRPGFADTADWIVNNQRASWRDQSPKSDALALGGHPNLARRYQLFEGKADMLRTRRHAEARQRTPERTVVGKRGLRVPALFLRHGDMRIPDAKGSC
jgi:hypothetical protein